MYKLRVVGGTIPAVPGMALCGENERPDIALVLPGAVERADALVVIAPPDTRVRAEQLITYGMGSRETVTFSSVGAGGQVLSLQRELVTLKHERLFCQDIPLLTDDKPIRSLFLSALLLTSGVPPEELAGRVRELKTGGGVNE